MRDPLSLGRIEKPGRSTDCKHLQCFDLKTYFTLNIKSEQFVCPVCNQHRKWSTLCFDEFYHGLLHQIPENVDKVEVFPDGTWKPVDDEKRRKPVTNPAFEINETNTDVNIREEVIYLYKNIGKGCDWKGIYRIRGIYYAYVYNKFQRGSD